MSCSFTKTLTLGLFAQCALGGFLGFEALVPNLGGRPVAVRSNGAGHLAVTTSFESKGERRQIGPKSSFLLLLREIAKN